MQITTLRDSASCQPILHDQNASPFLKAHPCSTNGSNYKGRLTISISHCTMFSRPGCCLDPPIRSNVEDLVIDSKVGTRLKWRTRFRTEKFWTNHCLHRSIISQTLGLHQRSRKGRSPRVPFVNCCQFMYLVISLLVLRAGCGIGLYRFLIIAYLFTFQRFVKTLENLKGYPLVIRTVGAENGEV